MLPAVYGCSAQQSSAPAPSIAITTVALQTKSYGTTLAASPTPIPVADQITTVLNSTNSFTVPTDGLAQYYSNNDASQQVFHIMSVEYTASNFSITDLPTDGNCQFIFETTLANTPANSQLNTWPLQGTTEGAFLPANSKQTGVRITTNPTLNRADVFQTSPVVGYTSVELANGVQILRSGGIVVGTNGTTELANIAFAAQNLGSSSSFDLVVKVLLGDGSTVSSPAQTITIPSGAVKTNLIIPANPTVNSYTTTTAAYGVQNGGGGGNPPVVAIDPSLVRVSALNTANSFTTPNIAGGVGMVQGLQDPPDDPANQVLHSWLLNLDTSSLTLSDYPATSLIVEYVFSWDADATNIDPDSAIVWDAETGVPSTVSGPVGSIFTQTIQVELDSINTNTLIPQASINFPVVGSVDTDYGGAWKAYSPSLGAPVSAPYTVNLQVKIQKTDGSFSESPVVALNMTDAGILTTLT